MRTSQATIGAGGFAKVMRLDHPTLPLAEKRILPEKMSDLIRKRFCREVRHLYQIQGNRLILPCDALQFIKDHHIVPVIERNIQEDNPTPWYRMPLAAKDAEVHLLEHSGLDAIWLFKQACKGIGFAHKKGVIHRDIKPHNILVFNIDSQSVAGISDFGIGRFAIRDTSTLTIPGMRLGTPYYQSPEQASGADVDMRTDIYSLGMLLYKIITGKHPIDIQDHLIQPYAFLQVFKTATRKDPAQRYASVDELLDALPS